VTLQVAEAFPLVFVINRFRDPEPARIAGGEFHIRIFVIPNAEHHEALHTDASGNVWLFGGDGGDSAGNFGDLNDLWKFSAGQRTWVSGANTVGQSGAYGPEGKASPENTPGARVHAVALTDSSGNVWLFAGGEVDSAGTSGYLNDLWKYEPQVPTDWNRIQQRC
jgi:hypothetical protein